MNSLSAAAQGALHTGKLPRHLRPRKVPVVSDLIYRALDLYYGRIPQQEKC